MLKFEENGKEKICKSDIVKVTRGVPQGSILGPIFFITFTNDLISYMSKHVPNTELVVFADDTNAVIYADDIETLNQNVLAALDAFNRWFRCNNLQLNPNKTSAMLFRNTSQNDDNMNIEFNGDKIGLVDAVKFLGVHIDCYLNWKHELTSIEGSISSACYALRSLRDELNLDNLKMVYYALVESRLRYSIMFWGQSHEYNIKKAFTCQKRAIRTMARIAPWDSCREHFIRLGILTVPCLYVFVLLTNLAKKLPRYESPDDKKARNKTRRRDIRIDTLNARLKIARHSARYQAVLLYNKLPTDLKQIDEITKFKNSLRIFLLKRCFYSVDDFINFRNVHDILF